MSKVRLHRCEAGGHSRDHVGKFAKLSHDGQHSLKNRCNLLSSTQQDFCLTQTIGLVVG